MWRPPAQLVRNALNLDCWYDLDHGCLRGYFALGGGRRCSELRCSFALLSFTFYMLIEAVELLNVSCKQHAISDSGDLFLPSRQFLLILYHTR